MRDVELFAAVSQNARAELDDEARNCFEQIRTHGFDSADQQVPWTNETRTNEAQRMKRFAPGASQFSYP
jgi:hypothetical protein